MKPFFLLLSSLIFAAPQLATASACCGGGLAAPALIVGDERAQMMTSVGQASVKTDIGADGLWRDRAASETVHVINLSGARIIEDLWQVGFAMPLTRKAKGPENSTGWGDLSLTLGYEYLPEWDYHPWKPRGHGYLQVTFPTGTSLDSSEHPFMLDVRGRGAWGLGVGTMLTKIRGSWDGYLNADASHFVEKTNVVHFGSGLGRSWGSFRLGTALDWNYETPTSSSQDLGSPRQFATASLSLGAMFNDHWSTSLNYADQTLLGRPLNSSLETRITLSLQRRLLR